MLKSFMNNRIGVLAIICLLVIGYPLLDAFLDNRPIKFENYISDTEYKAAVNEIIPLGSDLKDALNKIIQSKAVCFQLEWKQQLPKHINDYKEIYHCNYNTNIFSKRPLSYWDIAIYTDNSDKVIYLNSLHFNLPN